MLIKQQTWLIWLLSSPLCKTWLCFSFRVPNCPVAAGGRQSSAGESQRHKVKVHESGGARISLHFEGWRRLIVLCQRARHGRQELKWLRPHCALKHLHPEARGWLQTLQMIRPGRCTRVALCARCLSASLCQSRPQSHHPRHVEAMAQRGCAACCAQTVADRR